jgi:hypothetical protein
MLNPELISMISPMTTKRQPPPANDDEGGAACLLTSGDIGRLLDVDLKTVHNWVRLEHLSGLKTKGGHLRFHRAEVIRFMRRFGYPVPPNLGGPVPRVALVVDGAGAKLPSFGPDVRVEGFDRLFDAALAAASGGHEAIVVDLDWVPLQQVVDMAEAMRRRELTRGIAIVGISTVAAVRDAFVRRGGDVVIERERELPSIVRFLTGAAA